MDTKVLFFGFSCECFWYEISDKCRIAAVEILDKCQFRASEITDKCKNQRFEILDKCKIKAVTTLFRRSAVYAKAQSRIAVF